LSTISPVSEENPLQVRFDLAQELWQVGQHHTARAIVEEVVNQASGALLEQCQAWLNERQ
jgi:FimV-like protein